MPGKSSKGETADNSFKVKESGSRSVVSDSLLPHGLYSPWNFPGQNTGVGSSRGASLLQGIFPIQESNQGLLHCRQIFYQLSYQWVLKAGTEEGVDKALQKHRCDT